MYEPLDVRAVHDKVLELERRFIDRDQDMRAIDAVRAGDIDMLFPTYFSDEMPKSIVANLIDVAALDLAAVQAPLPSLACASGNMVTANDRRRASLMNKAGYGYWSYSKLQLGMFPFADAWNTYGFAVFMVEADFDRITPIIRVEHPHGCYYGKNLWNEITCFAKVRQERADKLAEEYPDHARYLMYNDMGQRLDGNRQVRIVHYVDKQKHCVFLPNDGCRLLAEGSNPLSRVPVVIAERPSLAAIPRGQFDDVKWVQLARAIMAQYQLSATEKAVNAPLAIPDDMIDVATGPDAFMRSQSPEKIRRVPLDVPRELFLLGDFLDKESKLGARYPDARTGGVQASVITGRGTEALLGTFDTQIKTSQDIFSEALECATSLCFEMDVVLWGNKRKTVSGVLSGKPYEMTYVPARDIGDNWTVKTTYGFAAGMTPAQAIVMLLQLRGDKWIGRDTARSHMPFDIDPGKEQQDLDVEQLEDALLQGMSAMVQAMGPMVMQGQDPQPVLLGVAKALSDRRKGKPLYDAVIAAFTPPEPEEPEMGAPAGPESASMPGEMPPGVRDNGLPQGVAYGQAGQAPGGMPSIISLINGLRENGSARMSADTMRKQPI